MHNNMLLIVVCSSSVSGEKDYCNILIDCDQCLSLQNSLYLYLYNTIFHILYTIYIGLLVMCISIRDCN